MRIFAALSLLSIATQTVAKPTIDPPPTAPPTKAPPGRIPPEIPTLDDLQRGVGIGDPSEHYVHTIEMVNGKISENSKERWEAFNAVHTTEHDGFNEGHEHEIYEGQMAYEHLIDALIEGNEKKIQESLQRAQSFMNENGLTLEDAQTAAESKNTGDRKKRFLSKGAGIWDECIIPYEYDTGFAAASINDVQTAMKTYEYYTGFRFVEWNSSVPALYNLTHSNRLTYTSGGGCWSYVGNIRSWQGQDISCCSGSTCIHEIGHAIGFLHEQESPLRDDYLRIEWDGINPSYWSQYYRNSKKSSSLFGYYDPTSVMHYWNGGFSVNYKDTFTTLDPERDFLVTRDTRYFYFFQEAMASHNCLDLYCESTLDCVNGGYQTVIGGECACFCPIGLDPATLCATSLLNDQSLEQLEWPEGSFTIFNSVDGCPDNFQRGWSYQKPVNYVWGSDSYHHVPDWQWWNVEHEYCSRIDTTNTGGEWPAGSYCIFRKGGTCPTGFDSGYIQMDNADPPITNLTVGELPDGEFGNDTRWEFCCRDDGAAGNPIQLPTRNAFILFQLGSCQQVEGMSARSEYFTYRSDSAGSYTAYEGSLPYMYKFNDHLFNLYYCFYLPIDSGDSEIIVLDSSQTEYTLQSPNYPSTIGTNKNAVYNILAPEGSKIQIDFNAFDLACSSDDQLEIAFSMPGHLGTSFCGSGFEKTIVSSENYARFTLVSGLSTSSTGFEAVLKIMTEEDQCYRNGSKDDSYSGNVDYTKGLEPCLPWNEVSNCRFSRFSPESLDDDLSENFCRNTGVGTDPWCYTNAETCARGYCDVCKIRKCYDLFDDCAASIVADGTYCFTNLDGQAHRGCRNSCGLCPMVQVQTTVTCSAPDMVDGVAGTPVKSQYTIGDKVEYQCGNDYRTRTCTSSGQWTHLGFVCGACPNGWGRVDGLCYKWFDMFLDKAAAEAVCNSTYNSYLAIIKTQAQQDHIRTIVDVDTEEMSEVWLGVYQEAGTWKWADGSLIDYNNWGSGQPGSFDSCGYVDDAGGSKWYSSYCTWTGSVVCTHIPAARTTCADQISNCNDMIEETPDLCMSQTDYAEANCPYSCGLCSVEVTVAPSDAGKREVSMVESHHTIHRRSDISIKRSLDIENQGGLVHRLYRRLLDSCQVFTTTTEAVTTTTTTEEPTTTTEEPTTTTTTEEPTTTTTTEEPTTSTTTEEPTTTTTTEEPTTTTTTEEPTTTTTTEEPTTTTTTEEPTTTTTTEEPTTTTTTEEPTTTTTEAPATTGCAYPGTPDNATLIVPNVSDEITVGQIFQFACIQDYSLASGDLTRACLVTHTLTGSEPVCAASSTVAETVNAVNIRRRDRHGSSSLPYTAYNDDMKITKSGYLTKWRFYSTNAGKVGLQVWRFADSETLTATLVGQNIIDDTQEDRIRTVDIPTSEQIYVQAGDVLGMHSGAQIPYTRCDLSYEPSRGNQRYISGNSNAEDFITGNSYTFTEDSVNCKTWSLNAFIK